MGQCSTRVSSLDLGLLWSDIRHTPPSSLFISNAHEWLNLYVCVCLFYTWWLIFRVLDLLATWFSLWRNLGLWVKLENKFHVLARGIQDQHVFSRVPYIFKIWGVLKFWVSEFDSASLVYSVAGRNVRLWVFHGLDSHTLMSTSNLKEFRGLVTL